MSIVCVPVPNSGHKHWNPKESTHLQSSGPVPVIRLVCSVPLDVIAANASLPLVVLTLLNLRVKYVKQELFTGAAEPFCSG
jgi:hypothetical protein